LMNRIVIMMGGRAAEEVFYGKEGITTGAEDDLQRATELAYKMVSMWGMSTRIGPMAIKRVGSPYIGNITNSVEVSPELMREIDEEVKKILTEAYNIAKTTVETYREPLKTVVKRLLERESITCEEFVEILKLYGVEVKTGCKKAEHKTFEDTKTKEKVSTREEV
ncbi:MAG TPA: cell division protein FtsH, partial [Aquifex aeolicus]|nr:cell division protein FtsH [Aquifex aeolicus]